MLSLSNPLQLTLHINALKREGKRIGFFPTMGALHAGHISLLKACKASCDISVCSIFVNPSQFTNPSDLENYPRTESSDILLLEKSNCDILFLPNKEDIYAEEKSLNVDFGPLTSIFEGASRPGHFQGVARIVRILFDCVQPDEAFFGLKDFQQCLVVQALVEQLSMKINLHFVPTMREADGLAMSSRNMRLSKEQRALAPVIYEALQWAKEQIDNQSIETLTSACIARIEKSPGLRVDYFSIVDARTLEPLQSLEKGKEVVALTAVYAGDIRLIDNLLLK